MKINKSTMSTDHDPVCIFFPLYETKPLVFFSCFLFGLDWSESKQEAKHRGWGCVCAGPSVSWLTEGERNVFPHDAGIRSGVPSATRHFATSSPGLDFRFDWPDHVSAYLLLIAFDSDVTMMQEQAFMNMPEFPIHTDKKTKQNRTKARKTKTTSKSCRALGKSWLKNVFRKKNNALDQQVLILKRPYSELS